VFTFLRLAGRLVSRHWRDEGMTRRRRHWQAMAMVPCILASGCALFRQPPTAEPLPPPPPVIIESRPPHDLAMPGTDTAHGLLTRAAMAVSVGLEAGGDALLEEFLRASPVAGPEARSRALVLRAFLALHQGGDQARRLAKAYLQAGWQADPGGAHAHGIALALDLLAALETESAALARSQARVKGARAREQQQADAAAKLRDEVESLQLQLEELKAIHLQIESDKEDTPSR